MKPSNTSKRLSYLMKKYDLKQVDILNKCEPFCKEYNVKLGRNDLSQYVSGKVEPGQNKLSILGMALNVSEAWLMGYDVPMERGIVKDDNIDPFQFDNIKSISTQKIPLIGEIACGNPIVANEEFESYIAAGTNIRADYCLKCKGDSMINARIFNGDIVFIKKQQTVNNGEIAAVIIDDEVTLKRVYFYPEENTIRLQPENPNYKPLVFAGIDLEQVRILGKAVAFQSDVR